MSPFPLLAAVLLLATSQAASTDAVTVSYFGQMSFVQHEPVLVTMAIKNHSQRPLSVDLGFNRKAALAVEIETPDHRVARPTLPATGLGRMGHITIRPGEEYVQPLLLNEWFPFEDTGTYVVRIAFNGAVTSAAGTSVGQPAPETLTLLVEPRNQAVLLATCRRLSATIMNSDRAEERMGAALALSYVNDGAGIPVLREVFQVTDDVDAILMQGLQKQRSQEALQLVRELAQDKNQERSAMARSILQTWHVTRDP